MIELAMGLEKGDDGDNEDHVMGGFVLGGFTLGHLHNVVTGGTDEVLSHVGDGGIGVRRAVHGRCSPDALRGKGV